jgi:hypothetical protein
MAIVIGTASFKESCGLEQKLISDLFEKANRSLRRRGIVGTLGHAIRMVVAAALQPITVRLLRRRKRQVRREIDERFDRKYGVDTSGTILKRELDIQGGNVEHATLYQAVYPGPFIEVMVQLPVDFKRSEFIDFGSGKGRALLLASEFPFKKIVGVEFSPKLCRIAEANLGSYQSASQKCQAIEVCCLDAVEYPIPLEPAVFYFYNPFDEEIMNRIVDNICKSLEIMPRPVFVVCFNPKAADCWDRIATFKIVPIRQPIWPMFRGQVVAVWTTTERREN